MHEELLHRDYSVVSIILICQWDFSTETYNNNNNNCIVIS